MIADISAPLISDLVEAMNAGSSARRVEMLRRVTDLFLSDADRLTEQQIGVFDDVLVRLIERIESRALVQLSTTLSHLNSAPREVVRQLAYHEEAAVAAPVLTNSTRLAESDLIAIASTRGQGHLLAISARTTLNEDLTDVLLKRGDSSVSHALAGNGGARFSEGGYATLLDGAERDDSLAEKLGLRLDIPSDVFRQLLLKATEAVRARLLKAAPPERRDTIKAAIDSVAGSLGNKPQKMLDYAAAENAVLALNRAGDLKDTTVNRFALEFHDANVVASIALLASVSIDAILPLMQNPKPQGLVIACKAANLSWPTVNMILRNRRPYVGLSAEQLAEARNIFEALSLSAAQRTIRFWATRSTAKKPDADNILEFVPLPLATGAA